MKDLFPGHYSPPEEAFENIWENGTFAFDANVLLGVFRLSESTVAEFLGILERLQPRLWLPHQAAAEYHRNLVEVIAGQQRPYSTAIESLHSLLKLLENPREHPFVSPEMFGEVSELFGRVETALKHGQERILSLLTDNPHKEKLAALFNGRVGNAYTATELEELYKEGAQRYADRTPPGYKDEQKPEPARYGDLVIWKQLLDFARTTDKPLVFVTGDVKEDWFLRAVGRTIGPHPHLVKEFRSASSVDFHIYTTTMFLQSANAYLKAGVPDQAIQEVRQSENDNLQIRRRARFDPDRAAALVCHALKMDRARLVAVGPVASTPYLIGEFEDGSIVFVHRTRPEAYAAFTPAPMGGYSVAALGQASESRDIVFDFNPEAAEGVLIDAALSALRGRYDRATLRHPGDPDAPVVHLAPGDRVRHPSFGTGTVLAVKGIGFARQAVIEFESVGKKTVVVRYARLQRIPQSPGSPDTTPAM